MVEELFDNTSSNGILPKDAVNLIKQFFETNLSMCNLIEEYSHSPFWKVKYVYNDIEIEIEGDIGFNVEIIIDKKEYPLWQYNREVINATKTNSKNILFVLGVIGDFIKDL